MTEYSSLSDLDRLRAAHRNTRDSTLSMEKDRSIPFSEESIPFQEEIMAALLELETLILKSMGTVLVFNWGEIVGDPGA